MDVSIKSFDVAAMKIKTKGIELDVYAPAGDHLGDLVITKARLEWCRGQTQRGNGKKVSWADFIAYMESL